MHIDELQILDALAVRTSRDLITGITPADLRRPTPCADWTLHGLLTHMTAQHHGFAAAAEGDGDLANWRAVPLGDDPVATYRSSVDRVLRAFAANGIGDRKFPLTELSADVLFTAEQALTFHFVDYVVHSWDVARTLGLPLRFDRHVVEAALSVARSVPDGPSRLEPGSPFAPAVAAPGASGLDEVVALLGRSPAWPEA
ncbi:TIGR03086 family metal-binding protein [Amycolatopsis suaedae]|uniref:TIGR03086 family protein n=1 Tax=Amycolatopsis suaedae TaxID=2510978 RepID=A0A4Q7J6N1_9PSEU|nr:TIGR03086 family metal-binding protein [Amycolatopsis suaedae]RZQ62496.1 TIGR03086 family protein [Amycolatopsis suaedae]